MFLKNWFQTKLNQIENHWSSVTSHFFWNSLRLAFFFLRSPPQSFVPFFSSVLWFVFGVPSPTQLYLILFYFFVHKLMHFKSNTVVDQTKRLWAFLPEWISLFSSLLLFFFTPLGCSVLHFEPLHRSDR